MHYLLKAILFRPVCLPALREDDETKQMMLLRAYRDLCTPTDGSNEWPALRSGLNSPGPFELGWKYFWETQSPLVKSAQKKSLLRNGSVGAWSSPTIWNTHEMELALLEARTAYNENGDNEGLDEYGEWHSETHGLLHALAPNGDAADSHNWPCRDLKDDFITAKEYFALQTLSIARNYDGIARAQAEKPKRQIDRDVLIPEQPLYKEGADASTLGGEGQLEDIGGDKGATLRQNIQLAHRFEPADLKDILDFNTAERRQAFVKELEETAFMQEGACFCIRGEQILVILNSHITRGPHSALSLVIGCRSASANPGMV